MKEIAECFKTYENAYSAFLDAEMELEAAEDEHYELVEHEIAHRIEYSDEYWSQWESRVGLQPLEEEIKTLRSKRDVLDASYKEALAQYKIAARALPTSKSRRKVMRDLVSEECLYLSNTDDDSTWNRARRRWRKCVKKFGSPRTARMYYVAWYE